MEDKKKPESVLGPEARAYKKKIDAALLQYCKDDDANAYGHTTGLAWKEFQAVLNNRQ